MTTDTAPAPTLSPSEYADQITDSGLDTYDQLDVASRIIADVRDALGPNPASEILTRALGDLASVRRTRV